MYSNTNYVFRRHILGYKNGKKILPQELIKQIQQYIDGEVIYIPRKAENRKCWGECTYTKSVLDTRNKEIFCKYQKGAKVCDLAEEYHISTQGIYKIISGQRDSD